MDTVLETRVVTRMGTRMVTVSIRCIHAPRDPKALQSFNFLRPARAYLGRDRCCFWLL